MSCDGMWYEIYQYYTTIFLVEVKSIYWSSVLLLSAYELSFRWLLWPLNIMSDFSLNTVVSLLETFFKMRMGVLLGLLRCIYAYSSHCSVLEALITKALKKCLRPTSFTFQLFILYYYNIWMSKSKPNDKRQCSK